MNVYADYPAGTTPADIDGPRPPRGVRLPMDAIEEADTRAFVYDRFLDVHGHDLCDAIRTLDGAKFGELVAELNAAAREAGI